MNIGAITQQAVQALKPVERKGGPAPAIMASRAAYTLDIKGDALARVELIRARIQSGYYNRPEVLDALATKLVGFV